MPLQIKHWQSVKYKVVVALAFTAIVGVAMKAAQGDGGVFTSTRHGSPLTGVQRLVGPDYPQGACVQCHYQHASIEGASTGAAQPYGLFADNDNSLCSTPGCHTTYSDNHIYPGPDIYSQSYHASAQGMVWPGAVPWARRSADVGKCINCHDPHGYSDMQGLIPSLGLAREESLCQACHDGSPAHTDIQREITKAYRHPAGDYSSRHLATEGSDFNRFGQANRHAECQDCHNVHYLRQQAGNPTPPEASERLHGVPYISVINGPALTTPTYVYHGPDDPTPVEYEYQLCFKCHSSWTVLPLSSPSGRTPTDKAKQFNPNNLSYHPLEAPGKNTGAVIESSLLPPYTSSSIVSCSDCHGSDSPSAPRGPHGSAHRFLLKSNYVAAENSATYVASDFQLCLDCHSESALMDESGVTTNFSYHSHHLTNAAAQGNRTTQPVCSSCHGNTHGSQHERLIDFSQEQHLQSFTSFTSKQAGGGTGRCLLTCHGKDHSAETY